MNHSRLRIGILLSGRGRGSNLQAIIDACRGGLVPGEVVRVVSTTEGAPALERARAAGVDALFVDPGGDRGASRGAAPTPWPPPLSSGEGPGVGAGRSQANRDHAAASPTAICQPPLPTPSLDARLIAAFRDVGADTIALTGFMRMLGPDFLQAFPQRILNIHPALLPCFGGQGFYGRRVHEAVLESGARFTGVTVHFVDELYDHGPIILQAVVPVEDEDTVETLAARVLEQEHRLYPEALRLLAEGRLEIHGRRVRVRR